MNAQAMAELRSYLHDLQACIASLNSAPTAQECNKAMELAIGIGASAMTLRATIKVPMQRRGRLYGYLPAE